nr:Ig-like domain-containing protein [Dyella flagellata]
MVDDPDENAEARLVISVNAPSHGQLIRKDDGFYLYKPDQGFSGADTFTYTVSDGITNASATITLNVRHDDDDDDGCWNSRTIFVSAEAHDNNDDDEGNGYIIINRRKHEHFDDEDSAAQLDWSGSSDADFGTMRMTDDSWWSTLFDDAMLGVADLSAQSGLAVKRPD